MRFLLTLIFALLSFSLFAQKHEAKINWLTVQEAVEANKQNPKPIFFDVYTDWCGWCKRMDATTFQHEVIAAYMNKHFYAVKFNAEQKETITVGGKVYKNSDPNKSKAPHNFAVEMLRGRLSYPSFAVYDSQLNNIGIVPGYNSAKDLEPILNYFGSTAYLTTKWEEYKTSFKGNVKF